MQLNGKPPVSFENFVVSTVGAGHLSLTLAGPKRQVSSTSPSTQGVQLVSDPARASYIPSALGLGTTTPQYNLDVDNSYLERTTNSGLLRVRNSAGIDLFTITDDGDITFNTASGNFATSRLVLQGTTQTEKLALASPTAGMLVFDTTSNVMSYYNGTNWFVPSILYLASAGQATGDVLWSASTASADARLSINTSTGVISVTDTGKYEVNVQCCAWLAGSGSERRVQLKFVQITGATTLVENSFQIADTDTMNDDFAAGPLAAILTLTAGQTYKFTFSSLAGNDANLHTSSAGFIRRIT